MYNNNVQQPKSNNNNKNVCFVYLCVCFNLKKQSLTPSSALQTLFWSDRLIDKLTW